MFVRSSHACSAACSCVRAEEGKAGGACAAAVSEESVERDSANAQNGEGRDGSFAEGERVKSAGSEQSPIVSSGCARRCCHVMLTDLKKAWKTFQSLYVLVSSIHESSSDVKSSKPSITPVASSSRPA
eukprot:CAMPEP_0113253908 /NCGR_PEP_ID=MMETSP0008_2-20120614/13426_1 /TAXON_ID=97485 /ORGANISM="Prymnesium parvum" /LENGTH=127 /DNA_ID=CAMNT_0000102105 /DNA_START=185 /DNA_END=564 /DNA_ORIENTATION=+ /assembly_acc=CAM_ASM_000153